MFESFWGKVVLVAIGTIIGMITNSLNLFDRYKKFSEENQKKKFKKNFLIGNPDFRITLSPSKNPIFKRVNLEVSILNLSEKTKFINTITYDFEQLNNDRFESRQTLFVNGEKWPKRIEHGEEFKISVDFQSVLINDLYRCWNKNVRVFGICESSTMDKIKSKNIDFDYLATLLEPLNIEYSELAKKLSSKNPLTERSITASLWQLQLFGRLTTAIARQMHSTGGIPIVKFLSDNYNIEIDNDSFLIYAEDINIEEKVIIKFLQSI